MERRRVCKWLFATLLAIALLALSAIGLMSDEPGAHPDKRLCFYIHDACVGYDDMARTLKVPLLPID